MTGPVTVEAIAGIEASRRKWRLAYSPNSFNMRFAGEYDFVSESGIEIEAAAMGLERAGETYVNWNGHPVIPFRRIQAAESGSNSRGRA